MRHERHPRAFGRTPPENRLRRISFGILFKMPITTTKLSKNGNGPTMDKPLPAVFGYRSQESRDRPRQRENLATTLPTVKHPENYRQTRGFSLRPSRYNRSSWNARHESPGRAHWLFLPVFPRHSSSDRAQYPWWPPGHPPCRPRPGSLSWARCCRPARATWAALWTVGWSNCRSWTASMWRKTSQLPSFSAGCSRSNGPGLKPNSIAVGRCSESFRLDHAPRKSTRHGLSWRASKPGWPTPKAG